MSIIDKVLQKAEHEGKKLDSLTNDSFSSLPPNLPPIENFPDRLEIPDTPIHQKQVTPKAIINIDWELLSKSGYVSPGDANTQTVEEYRSIKRPLINNAFGEGSTGIKRSNLILVTSSVPGEGKTFTTINLALSIANELDKKIMLIDADVARPSVSKVLGISKDLPGLIEYLGNKDVNFESIILKTNIPGFTIVPAGTQHKHSTELLMSNKMALLAQELSDRYADRIVIFDSPPLLAATQGEVLSGLVGQVILVVEAEKTPQTMVMESVKKLSSCDVVLALLNKSQRVGDAGYYGYGYGYGYGKYAN